MNKKKKLPLTEELDFAYLLELMPPLHSMPEYSWLPELFSIVGHESLLKLCKYCGGEAVTIPTLPQLAKSVEALQWFYDVQIKHTHSLKEVPGELLPLVIRIKHMYQQDESQND